MNNPQITLSPADQLIIDKSDHKFEEIRKDMNRIADKIDLRMTNFEKRMTKIEKSFLNKNWFLFVSIIAGTGIIQPIFIHLIK